MTPESSKVILENHKETIDHCKILLQEGKNDTVKVLLNLVSKNIKNLRQELALEHSYIIKKKDKINFKGFFIDSKNNKLFGYTFPLSEKNRIVFQVDINEYPVTNMCMKNNAIIVP